MDSVFISKYLIHIFRSNRHEVLLISIQIFYEFIVTRKITYKLATSYLLCIISHLSTNVGNNIPSSIGT